MAVKMRCVFPAWLTGPQVPEVKTEASTRRCHPQELCEVLRARLLAPALPFSCFVVSPRAAKRGAAEAIRASKSMA